MPIILRPKSVLALDNASFQYSEWVSQMYADVEKIGFIAYVLAGPEHNFRFFFVFAKLQSSIKM